MTLTPRQRQIVSMICDDAKEHAVASELGLKKSTISYHLDKIYKRIGSVGRCGLTKWAIRNGLTTL